MQTFERGFKTWSERTANSLRNDLDLADHAPINLNELARHLDVPLCTPRDIIGLPVPLLDQLLEQDPWGWSAVSGVINGKPLVIYNPRHSRGRQASNIAHEMAHIILDHAPGTLVMSQDGRMVMRSYDQRQEDEANWLGWCILLPREALAYSLRKRLTVTEIAEAYGVTEALVNFRVRITGLGVEFSRRRLAK